MVDSRFERIKTLTIIALVSDDDLMDRLVLKGGSALRLIHGKPVRQSLDLDFSLDGDLGPLDAMHKKIERLLTATFRAEGYTVFDVRLTKAPAGVTEDTVGDFWSGYTLEFKVMPASAFDGLASKPERRRIQALELGTRGQRSFVVDFSKHEHCAGKVARDVEGYRVFVYTPLMIACEKVRAICQQMEAYRTIVKSGSRRPRARDFFDIWYLVSKSGVHLASEEAWTTLRSVFEVKRVPLRLIGAISAEREFHRENFSAVVATVEKSVGLEDFDFYVDYLVEHLQPLQPRWEVDSPAG